MTSTKPTVEFRLVVSANEKYLRMLRYFLESLMMFGGPLAKSAHFVVSIWRDTPFRDLIAECPWLNEFPVTIRWPDVDLSKKYNYHGIVAYRLSLESTADIIVLCDTDLLFAGDFDALLLTSHLQQKLLGFVAHVSPFRVGNLSHKNNDTWWKHVFDAAGLPLPVFGETHTGWNMRAFMLNASKSKSDQRNEMLSYKHCPYYFNYGFVVSPRSHIEKMGKTFEQDLEHVDTALETYFKSQIANSLSFVRHHIPCGVFSLNYNYPLHLCEKEFRAINQDPEGHNAPDDIKIFHYLGDGRFTDEDFSTEKALEKALKRRNLSPSERVFQKRLGRIHHKVKKMNNPEFTQLPQRLGKTIPDYMIPSAFVMVERLPLTHTGKVDPDSTRFSQKSPTKNARIAWRNKPRIQWPASSPFIIGGAELSGTTIKTLKSSPMLKELEEWIPIYLSYWAAPLPPGIENAMSRLLEDLLGEQIPGFKKKETPETWGFQFPGSIFLLPFLSRKFPRMKFLHVISDGRKTAFNQNRDELKKIGASLLKPREKSWETPFISMAMWKRIHIMAARHGETVMKDRYLRVRVEDFIHDPAPATKRLRRFLGLSGDIKKIAPKKIIQSPATGRWKSNSHSTLMALNIIGKPGLEKFGYMSLNEKILKTPLTHAGKIKGIRYQREKIGSNLKKLKKEFGAFPEYSASMSSSPPCREMRRGDADHVKIVSIHVPKTAGTAFKEILTQIFDPQRIYFDYDDPEFTKDQILRRLNKISHRELESISSDKKAIHGHFFVKKYERFFPGAKRIVWLRHPLLRFISLYFYVTKPQMKKINPFLYGMLFEKKLDIIEFIKSKTWNDKNWNFCEGRPLSNFYFAGIQEFFAEDMKELSRILDWPPVTVPRLNRNKTSNYHKRILAIFTDENIINALLSSPVFKKELALYQWALDLRSKRRGEKRISHHEILEKEIANIAARQTKKEMDALKSGCEKIHRHLPNSKVKQNEIAPIVEWNSAKEASF
ncbi:hypothetical protein EPICR_100056 [Candidatus Desulfarcum epimagneticum]|uniref:Sulfotransferase domain-containing protein n=1 Tax=uncultured Desulfobacteraceae bacterium TaxID=218296 RepID=A0A484HHA3_9BACT|nr:hypothetical protein EPICR_100056 [uncultured Desulfobacteraceae bacterium]